MKGEALDGGRENGDRGSREEKGGIEIQKCKRLVKTKQKADPMNIRRRGSNIQQYFHV